MEYLPRDPHDIPLEELFPSLPADQRQEMRDFLDDYCAIAWQIWERLEAEHEADKELCTTRPDTVIDIIKS